MSESPSIDRRQPGTSASQETDAEPRSRNAAPDSGADQSEETIPSPNPSPGESAGARTASTVIVPGAVNQGISRPDEARTPSGKSPKPASGGTPSQSKSRSSDAYPVPGWDRFE